jgi:TorA maturation chaperone TorD
MCGENPVSRSTADDLARESLYRFLSSVIAGPYSAGWERALETGNQDLVIEAARWLRGGTYDCEMNRLVEEMQAPVETLRAGYDAVFGLVVPRECPPYETEHYPSKETFGRSQQLADVAGFYRAFGIEPAQTSPERPDHLALELEFMAFLFLKKRLALDVIGRDPEAAERVSVCVGAQHDFFRDHLAWWVPTFAAGLKRKASGGYPRALAHALAAWIPAECRRLGISTVLTPVRPELIEVPEEQSGCSACPLQL